MLVGKEVVNWAGWPTTEEILDLTSSGKSQAYAMMARLRELLPTLMGKPGRPASEPVTANSMLAISRAIQRYLMHHPGSAYFEQDRYQYLDDFRRFVVGLVAPGQPGEGLSVRQLAEASDIPLGTLKGWFHQAPSPESEGRHALSLRQEHIHQIITLFQGWKGTFMAFCRAVREQHRLKFGPTSIGTLLHQAGLRQRKNSRASTPNRGSYRKLFPRAQWLGDGSTMKVHCIPVQWGQMTFVFNLEVTLDVASDALVGADVSDTENEAAVLSAFRDGIATTGEAPLSLSLDNKPCNHTLAIAEATAEAGTTLLPTTPFRPQSKAPLEGAFGNFKQSLPDIVICGDHPREMARSVLKLIFSAWARGRNGRPRRNLGNKSPADYYREANPTPEEVANARRYVEEQRRKQEAMRRTREERADPIKLQFLKQALSDLMIADPNHRLAVDLAYYPLDSIVGGISTFKAKLQLGTIPAGADLGRYLRGVVIKTYEQEEITLTSELHICNRLRLRDLSLRALAEQAEQLSDECQNPHQLLPTLIDRALAATRTIDYHFWTLKCAETLSELPAGERTPLFTNAARRIAASFRADRQRKQTLLSRLARVLSE